MNKPWFTFCLETTILVGGVVGNFADIKAISAQLSLAGVGAGAEAGAEVLPTIFF